MFDSEQTIPAKYLVAEQGFLRTHEFYIGGRWQTFENLDVYRMPNSPVVLYSVFPEVEVTVPRDELLRIRPKGVTGG